MNKMMKKRKGTCVLTYTPKKTLAKSKRSQATIFIIIAIVIVAAVIIFFFVSDSGRNLIQRISGADINAEAEIKKCVNENDVMKEKNQNIFLQGGSAEPKFYY